MSRWRPSVAEERWLQVASTLGVAAPLAVLTTRTGRWRCTGPIARVALFVLGLAAAVLSVGLLGLGSETALLVAGVIVTVVAEWLSVSRCLHASGIEEGLCVAGFLLLGAWLTTVTGAGRDFAGGSIDTLVLIAAAGAAGCRRLNAFVTTCAVIALVYWTGSTTVAQVLDRSLGAGMTSLVFGMTLAAVALVLGAREFRRPSSDRMLDWLVATLPVAAYLPHTVWHRYEVAVPTGVDGATDAAHAATALLLLAPGAAMLLTGLRRRRHAPLLGFLGCVACLAVEWLPASGLATETWLILCGLAALVAGFALERYLRQPRDGLTSSPMTDDGGLLDLLQNAGAALLAQRAASSPAEPAYGPGEGRFGGGGASGGY
jgi:hypothetical protein